MSDLQCPATLLMTSAVGATETLAGRLADRAVRRVWSNETASAASVLAVRLGVDLVRRPDLGPVTSHESERAALDRFDALVQEIADLHRGETVLVLGDPELLHLGVMMLARRAAGVGPQPLAPDAPVEVLVDSDGLLCTVWPAD